MFETFLTRRCPLTSIADGEAATWGGGTATGVAATRYTCPLGFSIGWTGGATPEGFEIDEDQVPGRIAQGLKGSRLASVVSLLGSLPSESASLSIGEALLCLPQGVQAGFP